MCSTNFLFDIDPPDEPENIRIKDTTKDSITLTWNKPAWDGGSPILGYMVELKVVENESDSEEESDDEGSWKIAVNNTLHTIYELRNLIKALYKFRVSAINKAGVSDPVVLNG